MKSLLSFEQLSTSYDTLLHPGISCDLLIVYVQVRTRYAEQYDYDAITTLLGMEKSSGKTEEEPSTSRFIPSL